MLTCEELPKLSHPLDLDDLDATKLAHLHLGPAVTPAIARYLACDASVRLLLEQAGVPINEGHKYRTVPDKLRRVVEDRDRGCVYPGCHHKCWLVIHHLKHWTEGGPTETWNLVALCEEHHRLLHQGEYAIHGNADLSGDLRFVHRLRGEIPTGPRPAPPPNPPPGNWVHPTGEGFDHDLIWFDRSA